MKVNGTASHYMHRLRLKYNAILTLNKNLFISGLVGLVFSLAVAHLLSLFSAGIYLNSTTTVVSGFISYKVTFSLLFYRDQNSNTKKGSRKMNFRILKQVIIRMMFASTVFDIVNNGVRFVLLIQFLKMDYSPIESVALSSTIASILSYIVINLIVSYLHLFSFKNRI